MASRPTQITSGSSPPSAFRAHFHVSQDIGKLMTNDMDEDSEDSLDARNESDCELAPKFGTSGPTIASSIGLSREEERSLLHDHESILPAHRHGQDSRGLRHLFRGSGPKTSDEEVAGSPSETTALLNQEWQDAVSAGKIHTTYSREFKYLLKNSWPLVMTLILQRSLNVTSIFVVGRLGTLELGAVSLATTTVYISGLALVQGMAACLDTLCGQAYGSGHHRLVGLHVQRMVYFLWVFSIPIAIVWLNSAQLLSKIMDKRLAELTGLYLRISIIGLPGYAIYEGGKRYVQSQGLFVATTAVLSISAPLNVLTQWILVYRLKFGFIGSPIAIVIMQNLNPLLLICYVRFVNGSKCWGGFSRKALTNWGPMIRLAIPGCVQLCSEFIAFEVLTVGASFISTNHLAAAGILINFVATSFQLPNGHAIAASTRVANLIGASLPDAARKSAKTAMVVGFILGLINAVLAYALRQYIAEMFTSDAVVIQLFTESAQIVAAFQLFDAINAITNSLLRGLGQQTFGAWVQFLSYYVIGLPFSFGTAFGLHWNLVGLWLGVAIALVIVDAVESWFLFWYKRDWQKVVDDAHARIAAG